MFSEFWDRPQRLKFALPLFLAGLTLFVDPRLAAPFDLPKAVFLWLGALGMVLDFFHAPVGPAKPLSARFHFALALFLAMLLAFLPSLANSKDLYVSFFGAYPYLFGGLWCWLSYGFLLFLTLQAAGETFEERLIRIAMITTIVASIYAGIQVLELDPVPWENNPKEPFSTLGGGLFFGAYLALMTPVALAFYFLQERRVMAVSALLLLGLMMSLLLRTLSRSAWLGALAGAVVFLWFVDPAELWRRHRKRWTALGALAAAVFLWYLLIGPALRREPSKIQDRAKVFLSPKEGSARARIELWLVGIAMWLDHPWVGIGFDNVEQYFWLYRTTEHLRLTPIQATTAPLHNDFLHVLATTGSLGFLAYGTFLAAGAVVIWRVRKTRMLPRRRLINAAFAGGLAALGVFGQFNFSVAVTSAWAVVFLGCLIAQDRQTPEVYLPVGLVRGFAAGLSVLFGLLLIRAVMIYGADLAFARANKLAHEKNFPDSNKNFMIAKALNPHIRQYHYGHGTVCLARSYVAKTPKENLEYLKMALEAYEEMSRRFSWHSLTWHNTAAVLEQIARVSGQNLDNRILDAMRKAVALFPVFPRNIGHYAELMYARNRPQAARRLWQRALELDPRYVPSRRELERFKPVDYVYFFNQDVWPPKAEAGSLLTDSTLKLVNDQDVPAEVSLEIVPKEQSWYEDLGGYWDLYDLGWARLEPSRFVMPPNSVKIITAKVRIPRWPWWKGKRFVAIIHAKDNSVSYPFGAYGRILMETRK